MTASATPPQAADPAMDQALQDLEQSLAQALQLAVNHQQAGQLEEAETLYRTILQSQPNHPQANHSLGVLAVQANQAEAGLPHFAAALEARPEQQQYWLSYIDALIQADETETAKQVLALGREHGLQGDDMDALAARLGEQKVSDSPAVDKTGQRLKAGIEIVSATKLSENDFWSNSALGLSLKRHLKEDARLSVKIAFENSRGLPEIFNNAIDQAEDDAILMFIHDDVWIDEVDLLGAVIKGLETFDVIGVAGNRRRVPKQPAWIFIDTQFTWDDKSNLSGRVAHGKNAFGPILDYGTVPAACELLDGVFLATKKSHLKQNNVRFDAQFDFHFYDMDFCRSARKSGLRLGTWPIHLTHQSDGAFGGTHWREKYQRYLNKWETTAPSGDITPSPHELVEKEEELQQAINDVLQTALKHQTAGQLEQAEHIYLEVFKIQPKNAAASHNLGLIEINLKGAFAALPRLEIAVMEKPENQQYWLSYIDALIQADETEAAKQVLALGRERGLQGDDVDALAGRLNDICEDLPPPPSWPSPKLSLTANLDYIRQPGGISRRYVIYSPLYRHNSAGIRVLYELQKWLICAGLDAIIIVWANSYQADQFIDDIVIYPEVIFGNPLKAKRVVRYILNVPGKLRGDKEYAKNELLVAYNQELTCYTNGAILQVPSTETFFYNDGAVKTVNAVYVGKGQDLHLHPDDCIYITSTFPATRREVAQLLRSVKTLYLYDDFTMICHEAMLCGCVLQLISKDGSIGDCLGSPVPSIQEFKAQLHDFIEITKLM